MIIVENNCREKKLQKKSKNNIFPVHHHNLNQSLIFTIIHEMFQLQAPPAGLGGAAPHPPTPGLVL